MMKLFSFEKLQKIVKQQQVSCEKMSNVTKEEENHTTWISSMYRKLCCGHQNKQEGPRDNDDDNEKGTLHHVTDSGDTSRKHEKTSSPVNSSDTSSSTHQLQKEIVSLSPFLEEKTIAKATATAADHHDLKYRHLTQPFKPSYEVEWKKDQWLPLDKSTNQQIEKLRKKGFSKALVLKDPILCLEFSFLQQENDQTIESFSVRRVRWWHQSQVGCAHSVELPPVPSQHHGLVNSLNYTTPPFFYS